MTDELRQPTEEQIKTAVGAAKLTLTNPAVERIMPGVWANALVIISQTEALKEARQTIAKLEADNFELRDVLTRISMMDRCDECDNESAAAFADQALQSNPGSALLDRVKKLEAVADEGRFALDVLRRHHKWHQENPDEIAKDGYGDSQLGDDTTNVIIGLRNTIAALDSDGGGK